MEACIEYSGILFNLCALLVSPSANIGLIVEGIMVGSIFALAAYGLALVWGVMNVKNLAQGEFVIAGGYCSWWLVKTGWLQSIGLSNDAVALLGVPISFIVLWMIGWVVYKLVITRVIERDLFTSLLATFGLAIMMAQIMNILFGSDTQSLQLDFSTVSIGPNLTVAVAKLIGTCMALGLALGVILFMKRSRMGQAIRATSQDSRAARVMGIDTEKVYAFTFSLNAAICGAAGAIIVMVWLIQPFFGITYSIRAFVIVTAAGLGNLPGVIAAGLGMGAAESFSGFIFGANYIQATPVVILLIVLFFRLQQQRRKRQALS